MVRELLDETRQASLDEAGRARLAEIYHRAVGELREVLSPDLQDELVELAPPLEGVPSESEIRVAQAQLVGWLEGLFHGIQAAMFAQQAAARQQFEELRRRGLLSQNPQSPDGPPETKATARRPVPLATTRPGSRSRGRVDAPPAPMPGRVVGAAGEQLREQHRHDRDGRPRSGRPRS